MDFLESTPPEDDAFQLLTPDECLFALFALFGFAVIFYPYL